MTKCSVVSKLRIYLATDSLFTICILFYRRGRGFITLIHKDRNPMQS